MTEFKVCRAVYMLYNIVPNKNLTKCNFIICSFLMLKIKIVILILGDSTLI